MIMVEKVSSSFILEDEKIVKIKDYNVMTNGRNFFDQPIKSDLKRYDNIRKIGTGQGDDCTTGCLLDYPYFKK